MIGAVGVKFNKGDHLVITDTNCYGDLCTRGRKVNTKKLIDNTDK